MSHPEDFVLTLVGPPGLGEFVKRSLELSYSCPCIRLVIYECGPLITRIPGLEVAGHFGHDFSCGCVAADAPPPATPAAAPATPTPHQLRITVIALTPRSDGTWVIPSSDGIEIFAAALEHTVPTLGFVIQEPSAPGSVNAAAVQPRLLAHKEAYARQGVKNVMALIKNLQNGEDLTLPDGSILRSSECLGPRKIGKKLVLLGDTSDSSAIAPLALDCDVLVHEATNAFIPEANPPPTCTEGRESASKKARHAADEGEPQAEGTGHGGGGGGNSYEEVEALTKAHGHSTPQMAGRFARDIRAKCLILTHFSQRYKGDQSEASVSVMNTIRDQAAAQCGVGVCTAFDFYLHKV
eukprot:gnl/Spiro4/24102_TR11949_c0_g1_i1.p1 gnl/Spiro4/24102_TR11949_c0_g1~~gnl/Spiro4/24102_TR11949_c0_g1_i1.p1  ORF type:complete len:352 (-),score=45.95 gnl/Spiro4/24102_TR11949_c0_g1_i1:53-1108(-)